MPIPPPETSRPPGPAARNLRVVLGLATAVMVFTIVTAVTMGAYSSGVTAPHHILGRVAHVGPSAPTAVKNARVHVDNNPSRSARRNATPAPALEHKPDSQPTGSARAAPQATPTAAPTPPTLVPCRAGRAASTRLSIVIAIRNDNYAGFYGRMNVSLLAWQTQLAQYATENARGEIIYVVWGNRKDRESIMAAVVTPATNSMTNSEWVQIRVVTIEQEAVNNMNPTDFPFSEFAAKNIGIRRSYGEFVLATNVDNMAPRRLTQLMMQAPLDHGAVYRTRRTNIDLRTDPASAWWAVGAGFQDIPALAHPLSAEKLLGYLESPAATETVDDVGLYGGAYKTHRKLCSLYEKGVHVPYEELHVPKESETLFYGAAAGDFTLASRKAWDQIGGYPQAYDNNHLDMPVLCVFHQHGIKQIVLQSPCATIFHQVHEDGRGERREGSNFLLGICDCVSNNQPDPERSCISDKVHPEYQGFVGRVDYGHPNEDFAEVCRQLPAHTRPVDKQASGPSKTAPQAKPQTTVVTAAPPGSRDAATGMVASDLKVAICGMTRNQLGRMPRARKLMEGLGALFKDYRIVIVENDSDDGTKEYLQDWAQENGNVAVLTLDGAGSYVEPDKNSVGEIEGRDLRRLAHFRNQYLAAVTGTALVMQDPKVVKYGAALDPDSFDLVIVLDLDIKSVDVASLERALARKQELPWDVLAVNGVFENGRYYDIWAFLALEQVEMDYEGDTVDDAGRRFVKVGGIVSRGEIHRLARRYNVSAAPFEVLSAFSGMALYRADALRQSGCVYDAAYTSGKVLDSLTTWQHNQQCEHVGLHNCLRRSSSHQGAGYRIVLDPSIMLYFPMKCNWLCDQPLSCCDICDCRPQADSGEPIGSHVGAAVTVLRELPAKLRQTV